VNNINPSSAVKLKDQAIPSFVIFLISGTLFINYTRVQDNIPGLNVVPWVGIWFLVVTLWGISRLKAELFSTPIAVIFYLGLLYGIGGIGAISVISYKMSFFWALQLFPQCVAVYLVFRQPSHWEKYLKLWVVIYFVMGLFTLQNSPRGPGDFTSDENDICLAFAVGIPYVFYSSFLPDCSKKWRYFCYGTLMLMLLGVVLSSSRGGFLGVIAVFGAMWWLSVKRGKIAMVGCLVGIVAGSVLLSLLPPAYLADMESINDKEDGTRIERFHTWEIGWEMFKDKPIFGVGAGSFANTSHLYEAKTSWYTGHEKSLSGRASHSLYFQVIPELGIVGIIIFAYILFYLPLSLIGKARSLSYENKEERLKKIYLNILITSMAGYVIAGAFISVAYYPHMPMWLIMFSIFKYMDRDTENQLLSKEK
jgi:hypothetical protein